MNIITLIDELKRIQALYGGNPPVVMTAEEKQIYDVEVYRRGPHYYIILNAKD